MVKKNLGNKVRPFTEIEKMRRKKANRKMAIGMVALAIIQFLCMCVVMGGVSKVTHETPPIYS